MRCPGIGLAARDARDGPHGVPRCQEPLLFLPSLIFFLPFPVFFLSFLPRSRAGPAATSAVSPALSRFCHVSSLASPSRGFATSAVSCRLASLAQGPCHSRDAMPDPDPFHAILWGGLVMVIVAAGFRD